MNNTRRFQDLKVALVYDHLTTSFGGAELVLQTLHSIFPSAPLFTSVYQLPDNSWTKKIDVRTSFLQSIPWLKKYHQIWAPVHPVAFENFDLNEFDIIISVSNGPSKGVLTLPDQLHICYMLSPTRYLQQDDVEQENYFRSHALTNLPGVKVVIKPLLKYLKRWDYISAQRPDYIIAISKLVSERVKRIYHRDSEGIIYPPYKSYEDKVPPLDHSNFLLCLTRLASYKRVDLAIRAALETKQSLVIAGDGVAKSNLAVLAGQQGYLRETEDSLNTIFSKAQSSQKSIIFLGNVTESEKHQLLANCKALLMPGEEDFGLVGLEAASHGKPTVTFYKSGIAEILKDKSQAILVPHKSVRALVDAIQILSEINFSSGKIRNSVKEYEVEWFKELFHKTIYHLWRQHSTISRGK